MMKQVTPVILTYNEEPNLRRTLEALSWARDIVIVDSFSDDTTLTIAAGFPQARVFQRRFDSLENQCNFALKETGLSTEWVLALDADYVLTPEVVEEIKGLKPTDVVNGYRARFVYCVHGKSLRGSAYPPVTVLYRRKDAFYRQDGHAHRVVVKGEVQQLRFPILHDDRKSLSRWLWSQDMYMRQELWKFCDSDRSEFGWPDRLRKTRFLFPFVIFFYCLFVKGGIRDGWAGVYYAFQRMLAETLLALYLIEEELAGRLGGRNAGKRGSREHGAGSEEQGARDQKSDVRGQRMADGR